MNRATWREQQIGALVALGDSMLDAEMFVDSLLAQIPKDANPAEYPLPIQMVTADADVTGQDISAARAEWYAKGNVPPAFKRLLDAQEV